MFIKGLQDIPSAKVFGLDLVHYLDQNSQRHTASESIQAEIQDVFAEKEVRIRLPIEELKVLLLAPTLATEIVNQLIYSARLTSTYEIRRNSKSFLYVFALGYV